MSCSRASKFLEASGIDIKEQVPASRKLGEADARALIKSAGKIYVAKGKKLHDKRETSAKRDWNRQKQRLMKDHS